MRAKRSKPPTHGDYPVLARILNRPCPVEYLPTRFPRPFSRRGKSLYKEETESFHTAKFRLTAALMPKIAAGCHSDTRWRPHDIMCDRMMEEG